MFVPPRQKNQHARSVDEHEARIPVLDHCLRREDGDAALALDCIGIQVRVAVIDASAGADLPRVEEHCLGKRGLTCIHMRQDADNCLLHAFLLAIQIPLRPCCREGRASKPMPSAHGRHHVRRLRQSPPFHMPPIVAHRSVNTDVDA